MAVSPFSHPGILDFPKIKCYSYKDKFNFCTLPSPFDGSVSPRVREGVKKSRIFIKFHPDPPHPDPLPPGERGFLDGPVKSTIYAEGAKLEKDKE